MYGFGNMLNTSYLLTTNRLPQMLQAIQNAGVPPRFTHEFVKTLGFKSTNDRAYVGLLKGIGFLDDSGVPTESYRAYRNRVEAKKVLGAALRRTYDEVFLANENAQDLTVEALKGIIAARTGKGDSVVKKMASTFKALTAQADLKDSQVLPNAPQTVETNRDSSSKEAPKSFSPARELSEFHYNIQIHLPVTKDISVYNAIFKSLRDHLV
ncbi:MAG: hypothetical protein AMXMBFR16_09220 [Candidatus Uhrbacteria bacterium]